jgi:indoleamine 2,3-dioxygenase
MGPKMYQPLPRLSDFDVSPLNGFLPTEPPCARLPDPYYDPWERIIGNLQALVSTKRLRREVDSLPILSTSLLREEAEWRRAYSILGFITHAFIWGGDIPTDVSRRKDRFELVADSLVQRIPPPVSIPFLSTCEHLELPPVATYAGTVLWNWRALNHFEPVDNLENIFTLHTLTGSLDESWFFLVSVAIEARSAPMIPLMLDAVEAARYNDQDAVMESLRRFAERLDELGTLLTRMYENCDPHVFYHRIRPMLAGSKNMADAGLPNGVLFDTGSEHDEYVQFSGGSNAQSSIIQFFDIILGVEHRPTGTRPGSVSNSSASDSETNASEARNNFLREMRQYMPGPHKRFLHYVEQIANLRPFVVANAENAGLRNAYDACLAMLRTFRDIHIQMVSRYIILKSRDASKTASPRDHAGSKKMNLAVASTHAANSDSNDSSNNMSEQPSQHHMQQRSRFRKLRGTGGTALIPFLKQARDETGEPAIDAWASRLLNNGPGTVSRYRDGKDAFAPAKMQTGIGNLNTPGARLTKMGEHASGEREILGLAGVWTVDDSEGGICHW